MGVDETSKGSRGKNNKTSVEAWQPDEYELTFEYILPL